MPVHKDFHGMLDGMTEQYCTGEDEETTKTETAEEYPGKTCRKALSVFYATCQKKSLDYTKPMPKEKVREHVSIILPFKVLEKIGDKPVKIGGVAALPTKSRNGNMLNINRCSNKLTSKSLQLLRRVNVKVTAHPSGYG